MLAHRLARAAALGLLAVAVAGCDPALGSGGEPGDAVIYPLYLLSDQAPVKITFDAHVALLTETGLADNPFACDAGAVVAGDVEGHRWARPVPVCSAVTPGPVTGLALGIEAAEAEVAAGIVPAWPEDDAGLPTARIDLATEFGVRANRVHAVSVRLQVEELRCLDETGAEVGLDDPGCAEVRYHLRAGLRTVERIRWTDFRTVPQQLFGLALPGTSADRLHEIAFDAEVRVVEIWPAGPFLFWYPRRTPPDEARDAVRAAPGVDVVMPNTFVYPR
jgi:hypothetical protein